MLTYAQGDALDRPFAAVADYGEGIGRYFENPVNTAPICNIFNAGQVVFRLVSSHL
jgi:hypothetical protein